MNGGPAAGNDSPNVLLVGATPRDARVVASGLAREGVSMDVAADVRAAIDQLTCASEDRTEATLPDLVALDLSAAPSGGLTVLNAIKTSPRLRTLPAVAFVERTATVNGLRTRVRKAYECGLNGHVSKPDDVEAYADAVEELAAFWFGRVSLPPESLYSDSTAVRYD